MTTRPDPSPDEVRNWLSEANLSADESQLPKLADKLNPFQATMRHGTPVKKKALLELAIKSLG